jgi:hypothetical protein
MRISNSNVAGAINGNFVFNKKLQQICVEKIGFFKKTMVLLYSIDEVVNFKVMDPNITQEKTKRAAGTIGGAIVGGVLTGGVGAIVGAMACGNSIKVSSTTDVALEFNDGNWIIIHFDNTNKKQMIGRLQSMIIDNLKESLAQKAANPFK